MKRNVKEIIDFADELRENTYSYEMKASWLNEAETLILSEIHNIAPDEITPIIPYEEHKNDELTLDVTRDKIYILYLTAMIDFADKEYAGYNNSIALFNEQLDTYAKWYVRTHKDGEPLISGMYLSAYGLAVSHGYTGTEEEWLLSLKGERGDTGHGLNIKGVYETKEALTSGVLNPSEGDIYQVGTSDSDKTLYLYSGTEWKDIGSYRGEKGEKGDRGDTGAKGDKGEKGDTGAAGKTPVKGVDYFTDSEVEEILKSAADANENEIKELKSDIGDLCELTEQHIEDSPIGDAEYYKHINPLEAGNKYELKITVSVTGKYTFSAGTTAQASSMVDVIKASVELNANEEYSFIYTPTGAYTCIRCVDNNNRSTQWSLSVYKMVSVASVNEHLSSVNEHLSSVNEHLSSMEENEIKELKNDLAYAVDHLDVENIIEIDVKDGYYTAGNRYLNWTADVNRRAAIVPINSAKRYKLTTNIGSAALYGLFCISADNPTPEALFYCTILDKKYIGDGSTKQTISEEIVIPEGCTHIVIQSTDKTEPVLCEIDKVPVFRAYTKEEADMRYGQIANAGNPHMVTDLVIHVSDDITATPVMGSGWTSTETNSYTHAANGAGDLSLEFSGDVGSVYLVEFDTSFTGGEFVRVGIGTGYRVLAYNGTNHIVLPLTAYENTTLYITPYASGITNEFTISGLKIRKIQDVGDEVILTLNSVYTDNHHVAYGFWNVLLGNAAPMSSAITRTVAIGHNALSNLQGGHRNVAIGTFALSKLIGGENNISIGSDSLYLVERADNNVSIGNWSMQHAEGATECISVGQYALENCGASRNVAIGGSAGKNLSGTSAWKNTYVGYRAGTNNFSGGSNVAIGYDAKGGKNGSRNVNIGENSVMSENVSDSIAIGSGVGCTESNQIVIGNNAVKSVIIAGIRINFNEDNNINLTGSRIINFSNDGHYPFYIDTTNSNDAKIVFPVTLGPEKGTDLIISMNTGMPYVSLPFGYDNYSNGITFRAGHVDTPTFTDNSTGKEVMLYPTNTSEVSDLSDALDGKSVFGLLTDLADIKADIVTTDNANSPGGYVGIGSNGNIEVASGKSICSPDYPEAGIHFGDIDISMTSAAGCGFSTSTTGVDIVGGSTGAYRLMSWGSEGAIPSDSTGNLMNDLKKLFESQSQMAKKPIVSTAITSTNIYAMGDNTEYLLIGNGAITGTLTLDFESVNPLDESYASYISFETGNTPPTVAINGSTNFTIVFKGDDCNSEGNFIPAANKKYEVALKRVGTVDNKPYMVARVGVC